MVIRDSGRGIAPDGIEANFYPNISSNEGDSGDQGGGLAGVVRILAQLGARLEIASEVGTGTCVWVYFPASFEPPPERTPSRRTLSW